MRQLVDMGGLVLVIYYQLFLCRKILTKFFCALDITIFLKLRNQMSRFKLQQLLFNSFLTWVNSLSSEPQHPKWKIYGFRINNSGGPFHWKCSPESLNVQDLIYSQKNFSVPLQIHISYSMSLFHNSINILEHSLLLNLFLSSLHFNLMPPTNLLFYIYLKTLKYLASLFIPNFILNKNKTISDLPSTLTLFEYNSLIESKTKKKL